MKTLVYKNMSRVMNAVFCFLFLYLLIRPTVASAPTVKGIIFCIKIIVPSLFIYIVLSRIIVTMPFIRSMSQKLGRYGQEIVILILGTLCGFPVGAKSAVILYEQGHISKTRAEFISSFSNNASMSFLLGFVGATLFGDIMVGVKLCIFQLTGAIITAVVLRVAFMKKEDFAPSFAPAGKAARVSFAEAVADGTKTIVMICAYIITFMILSEAVLSLFEFGTMTELLIRGFFEFSTGISDTMTAAGAGILTGKAAFVLISLFLGFSGICVLMQVVTVLKAKMSPRLYLTGRLINTCVMGLMAIIIGL